jgi:chromosome segregation ATPase
MRVRESLFRDDELIDEGSHALKAATDEVARQAQEIERLRAELAEAVTALPQVVRNERERCAKECERISQQYKDAPGGHALERAAHAIRAQLPD